MRLESHSEGYVIYISQYLYCSDLDIKAPHVGCIKPARHLTNALTIDFLCHTLVALFAAEPSGTKKECCMMCLKTVLDTTDKYDAGIYKEMKETKW